MKRVCFGWIVLCALMATSGCRKPSPEWTGTWKLNPTKSSYQGPVLTISVPEDGEYRFYVNSGVTLDCDGKNQSVGSNRTLKCVKDGVTALDITLRENGVITRTTRDELSVDGKFLKTTVTELRPNGPGIKSQISFSRLSGSSGFAGQWRDTSYLQQHADMTLRLGKQALHINYPSAGQFIDAPLDGVDAAVHGILGSERITYSTRSIGRREIRTLTKRNGKVFAQGSLKLSNDGTIITDSWWNPDHPGEKNTLVYEKQ